MLQPGEPRGQVSLSLVNTDLILSSHWTILTSYSSLIGQFRAGCSWGGIVEGDQILAIGGQEIRRLTRLECVKALKGEQMFII